MALSDFISIFTLADKTRVYLFILTGGADGLDDITIPISSFQSTLNTISVEQAYERKEYFTRIINEYNNIYLYNYSVTYGDYALTNYSTYLSVVIPGFDYIDAINARLHGELVLKIGYVLNGELLTSEIITTVLFENINVYEGAINKSIVLEGHGLKSTSTYQNIILSGITYKDIKSGIVKYRCSPELYLKPGDTAIGTVNISDIVWLLPFTNGISEISVGDTVTGETSLASGVVSNVRIISGAWWALNAVGVITLNSLSGTFQAENLKVGGIVKAVTNGNVIRTYSAGEDSYTVGSITYSVSADQELYEVSE